MAIADLDKVMPRTFVEAALAGTPWLAQPPHVGIASGVVGGVSADVLWDTGESIQDQAVATLLEIAAPDAGNIAAFSGRIVRRAGSQSSEYIGAVVLLAKGDFAGGLADFAIVKSVGPGGFYWAALVTELEALPNR